MDQTNATERSPLNPKATETSSAAAALAIGGTLCATFIVIAILDYHETWIILGGNILAIVLSILVGYHCLPLEQTNFKLHIIELLLFIAFAIAVVVVYVLNMVEVVESNFGQLDCWKAATDIVEFVISTSLWALLNSHEITKR